ncbi:MAG: hypothetical protein ACI9KE_001760 [Polyangiales bacterium]|jgi:hypothetical protein
MSLEYSLSMTSLPFRLSFLALMLLQVACGSDELSVRGEVLVGANGADHVFSFPNITNLTPASYDQEVFSGSCGYFGDSVVASIIRPGRGGDGLSQFNVETNADGAEISVSVDGMSYEGQCSMNVLYRDEDDGVFAAEFTCDELGRLGGAGDAATLTGELHFAGCVSF